ncbi:TolC family protein [Ginsengibacter hankyongi]|uniref:TolC family protein n=1 Tax=Ginsengibacter hankyongi TaxID=2607284 RepID=UPI001F3B5949|nr:TolC family protein [Ginsengibacter hankyongi]
MKQLKIFLTGSIFLLAFLIPVLSHAQDTTNAKYLSLQEAIDLSIKNSKQLKSSEARIEEATGAVREAEDNKLPSASVSGSYLRLTTPTVSLKTKAFGGGSDSTGGGSSSKISQAMYGMFNVSLPIYAGGRIRYGIESAKYLQEAVTLDGEGNKEAVILNTINAYTNLYKASVTVNVVKQNLLQSLHRDSVLSRLEQNGLLARNDLLKAQLQSSNIELSVLDAENNQKIANVNMNLMLGLPEQTQIVIDSSSFEKPVSLKNLEEYEQLALQNRKDILALSFREKAASTGIAAAKAEMYPSIALTGGYVAADIPHFITITNAITFGVGVKYDLGSLWKTKAKIVQAQAREKEISAGQAQLDDDVRLQVNKDYENILLSQKKTEVYQKAVAQATENYRITKNKYDNNLVNTSDLLDANVSLLQSEISLAVAKADVLLAYDKLLETSGLINNK